MEQNAYPGAPSAAAPAAGMIPSIRCPNEDLNPGMRGLGQMLKFLRFLMTVNITGQSRDFPYQNLRSGRWMGS